MPAPRAVSVPLPRLLSLLPNDGVGARVFAARWAAKGLPVPAATTAAEQDATCYWDVKKVRLNVTEAGHVRGRAYGVLNWKGKRVTQGEFEPIRGGLKYLWQAATVPPALVEQAKAIEARRAAAAATASEAEA
ncbi:hypothetical protein BMF94_2850 [Rhodotorula taiwanensis]|uniref:Uncharacterized protein n=1 Tax=Rhodotorula taiwanensis TaxID=741276 RepID=A0A2S5BBA6_9BASI|nr:hypothetical protein BMF94_2850 [Rhodotorula taiwanensis]